LPDPSNKIVGKLYEWYKSPLLFVTECIDATPSEQQAEALRAFSSSKRMSIRSGHGTGKDAFASWMILWFMSTRPYAKVACTAPTARQLGDILWSELAKWLRRSKLESEFVIQKDKFYHKSSPKEWWTRAISPSVRATKEDQAETLAGLHGDHLLIIVDEASGVNDPVFIPLEGAMTQEDNHVLLIGNPTKNTGYFHETQFHPQISRKWTKFHWDSRKSTNVSKEMVQYFTEKYGEDSNVFRIRVAGEPPLDDENTFIPLSWALQCKGNEFDVDETWPLYLAVDVARYGEDESIILPRRGNKIYPWENFKGLSTIKLAQHVLRTYIDNDASGVGIDEIGVGGGVVDWLIEDPRGLGPDVTYGINVAESSSDNKKYRRLRDELWAKVREKCMNTDYSFPDVTIRKKGVDINIGDEIANELSSVYYKIDGNGAIQIESKHDMKARGLQSPNIADALCISEYFHSTAFAYWGKQSKKVEELAKHRRRNSNINLPSRNRWMVMG
jgi:phage terminase large subunit